MVEQLQFQPLRQEGRLTAALDSDLLHAFLRSKITIAAALVTVTLVLAAVLAPWIAPYDPFDLRQLNLLDSHLPPAWLAGGDPGYVLAARLIGIHPAKILFRHVLPNVIGPVLVIATINLALAIITEATLSFLGVGLPPTQPSLGTLIRIGNNFLFAGEWWIAIFPGITLALLVVAINLLGDWLRDALNPRLQ